MSGSETEDTDPIDSDDEFVKKKEQTPAPACTGHPFDPDELPETPVLTEPPSDGVANRPKKRGFSPHERRVPQPMTPETPPRSNAPWYLSEAEQKSLERYQNEISP